MLVDDINKGSREYPKDLRNTEMTCHHVAFLSHSGAMLQVADSAHESSSTGPGTGFSTLRNITAEQLQSWVQDLDTSRVKSQFAIQIV